MMRISMAIGFASAALLAMPVNAADIGQPEPAIAPIAGQENSLLFAGIASIYLGYIDFEADEVDVNDAETFIIGGRGAVSIPFADMFSIQLDVLGERSLEVGSDNDETVGDVTLAAHVSYRDPASHLIGLFGGGGWSFDNGDDPDDITFVFVGAEGQVYWNQFTLYGQAGYLDGDDFFTENVEDAWFGRGVVSYYYSPNTKISGELSYLSGDRFNGTPGGPGELEVLGWGAKIQHIFDAPMLPVPAGLSLAYNGFDYRATDESDSPQVHEVRLGVDFLFGSQTLMDNDRRAAGLDLPFINRWVSTSTNEIE